MIAERVTTSGAPQLVDLGDDRVLAVQRATGRAKASGVETEIRYAVISTLRDGKIARGREYIDRDHALEAAGLSDEAMSQENIEVVRSMCEAFLDGDIASALDKLDVEVKWHGTIAGLEEGRTYRGHQEVINAFVDSLRDWERHSLEVERYIDAGDRVVVLRHETGRGKGGGAEVETRTAVIYRVEDGKVVEVQGYMNRAEALEAVGLRG